MDVVTNNDLLPRRRGRRTLALAVPALAAVTAAGAFLAWFVVRPGRVEVAGASMLPSLEPGDRLVVVRARRLRPGDVVALADPRHPARTIVKRVAAVGPGTVSVVGDNPTQSTDSRVFGAVDVRSVRGRAVYRYAPPARRGRVVHGEATAD